MISLLRLTNAVMRSGARGPWLKLARSYSCSQILDVLALSLIHISWGVGTNLITAKDCPSFGGVYKLAAVMDRATGQFVPKIKLSENAEKITNPGNKTIQRIYDKATGKIIADLICLVGEEFDTRNSLLLFDPLETWKKTMLAPDSYTMREPVSYTHLDVYKRQFLMWGRSVIHSSPILEVTQSASSGLP